ncbi:MAG: hypothetical protein HY756_05850 [Nitrospirae bacterium]|nr:hypothetical protein [Nitrospirota bacterium]
MMQGKKSKSDKSCKKAESRQASVSFHLKCAKTANGLTHFVMYGDVPKKKTLL